MKRILAIVGDYYHDAGLARQSLQQVAEPLVTSGQLEVTFAGAEQLEQELMTRPDLIVLFAEDRINPQDEQVRQWMTVQIAEQIERYVNEGGAWLAWHSGLASYPEEGVYVKMLRGHFLSHPEQHSKVTYTPLSGTELGPLGDSFSFMDEHYFVACDEDETNVFMRSASVDGNSTAGWYHSYGSGRVACITPAHLSEGLLMPQFIDIMRSLIVWCIRLE